MSPNPNSMGFDGKPCQIEKTLSSYCFKKYNKW